MGMSENKVAPELVPRTTRAFVRHLEKLASQGFTGEIKLTMGEGGTKGWKVSTNHRPPKAT